MKNLINIIAGLLITVSASAQIPYFHSTQGKNMTYTYFSTKFHPTTNNQQMYITAAHGLTNYIDVATDATVGTGYCYQGFGLRGDFFDSKYFGIGAQAMADFDLNNNYHYAYNSDGLYINGSIVEGLGYCSNTWLTLYDGSEDDPQFDQWTYLSYEFGKITPMAGLITDLDNDCKSDLAVGFYYEYHHACYAYVWGSNLTKNLGDRRIVLGFDYKF
jgi:hypothetical protein